MISRLIILLALTACGLLAACESEPRIVAARGGLFGLPGAQSGLDEEAASAAAPATTRASSQWESVLRSFPGYEPPPDPATINPDAGTRGESLGLRRNNPDGSVTLFARSPADVMYHLMTTLDAKEHDLLLDQVIADQTKAEYRRRGRDPREAVDFLAKRRSDIAALFATFPMGDQTPGVRMDSIGRNAFRLSAPVAMAQELRLHSFDVVIERGNFRLMMIR